MTNKPDLTFYLQKVGSLDTKFYPIEVVKTSTGYRYDFDLVDLPLDTLKVGESLTLILKGTLPSIKCRCGR